MEKEQSQENFTSAEKRKRLRWIVIAHVLIVVAFFTATFYWGNFE
jgi:flagellar basal body-associated protein FliL